MIFSTSYIIMWCILHNTDHFQANICNIWSVYCYILLLKSHNVQGSITNQRINFQHHNFIPICIYMCYITPLRLSCDVLTTLLVVFTLRFTIFWVYTAKSCYLVPIKSKAQHPTTAPIFNIIITFIYVCISDLQHLPGYHWYIHHN